MQTIKLSTKNFWFKYWNFLSYSPGKKNAPSNTCDLKRALIFKTIFHLLTFPMFLITNVFSLISKGFREFMQDETTYVISAMIQFVGTVMAIAILKLPYALGFILGPIGFTIGAITSLLLIVGIVVGISKLINLLPEKEYKEKKPSIIKVIYNNWKDKLCSKIEYTD